MVPGLFLALQLTAATSDPYPEGLRLLEEHQLPQALSKLQQAAELRPGDAQRWKSLGVVAALSGDYAAAEEPFAKACKLDPALPDACYYWARALYSLNKFKPSIEILQSLKEQPRRSRTLISLGQAHEALGLAPEAERYLLAAIAAPDSGGEARMRYGMFLFRSGRVEEAGNYYEAAIKMQPRNAEATVELGRVRYQQGRLADSEKFLKRALELEPGREQALLLLERVRRLQGVQ